MKTTFGVYSTQKWVCIIIGVYLMFGFQYLPPFTGLEPVGMQVLGIFLGTIFLWLTVSTIWTSILTICALTFCPLYTYTTVLQQSWGNWIVPYIIYSSLVTAVLEKSGFLKRCALWFITRPSAKKSPWNFIALFLFAPLAIGAFMSTIPTFIVFLPIAEQIFRELGWKKGDRVPQLMVLGCLFSTCISSAMTPVAHTFVLLAISRFATDTGVSINFLSYMTFGIICGLLGYLAMLLIFRFIFKPDLSPITNLDIDALKKEVPPFSKQEKYGLIAFVVVVVLWLAPGILDFFAPAAAAFVNRMGIPMPAMIGVILLCLMKVDDKPLFNFGDAMKTVPWGAVNLVAATQVMASSLVHEGSGITTWLTSLVSPVISRLSGFGFAIVVILFATFLTNFISNTVNVTMVYGIVVPVVLASPALGVHPAAMAALIGAASCLAMASPPGTAHAAMAAGTGWCDTKTMLIYGMMVSMISGLFYAVVGYPIATLVL